MAGCPRSCSQRLRGCTHLEWTAESYRDQFDVIADRAGLVPLDRSSDWQQLGLESIPDAGADGLVIEEGMPGFLREVVERRVALLDQPLALADKSGRS